MTRNMFHRCAPHLHCTISRLIHAPKPSAKAPLRDSAPQSVMASVVHPARPPRLLGHRPRPLPALRFRKTPSQNLRFQRPTDQRFAVGVSRHLGSRSHCAGAAPSHMVVARLYRASLPAPCHRGLRRKTVVVALAPDTLIPSVSLLRELNLMAILPSGPWLPGDPTSPSPPTIPARNAPTPKNPLPKEK